MREQAIIRMSPIPAASLAVPALNGHRNSAAPPQSMGSLLSRLPEHVEEILLSFGVGGAGIGEDQISERTLRGSDPTGGSPIYAQCTPDEIMARHVHMLWHGDPKLGDKKSAGSYVPRSDTR